jgi:hypothetical protein
VRPVSLMSGDAGRACASRATLSGHADRAPAWPPRYPSRHVVSAYEVRVSAYEVRVSAYAGFRTVRIVGLDRRVSLVGLPHLSGHVQPTVDVPDFEHLILGKDLLAFPRA